MSFLCPIPAGKLPLDSGCTSYSSEHSLEPRLVIPLRGTFPGPSREHPILSLCLALSLPSDWYPVAEPGADLLAPPRGALAQAGVSGIQHDRWAVNWLRLSPELQTSSGKLTSGGRGLLKAGALGRKSLCPIEGRRWRRSWIETLLATCPL